MSTIILTLNSNFTDPSDLDKKVKNVFKMFKSHLKNKTSPISKESDMESVYEYNNLNPDNVRIFKKLSESNKSILNLKDIKVDGDKIQVVNNDSGSESESGNESDSGGEDEVKLPVILKPITNKFTKQHNKVMDNYSDSSDSDTESEKETESVIGNKEINSESESDSDKDSYDSDSDSDSENDEMKSKIMVELSTKIDDMQSSIKNIESMLSKF